MFIREMLLNKFTLKLMSLCINAIDMTSMDSASPVAMPQRLTWQGHQFLNACRDESRWAKAKTIFKDVGGVSFDVAKDILVQLMLKSATTILSGGAV